MGNGSIGEPNETNKIQSLHEQLVPKGLVLGTTSNNRRVSLTVGKDSLQKIQGDVKNTLEAVKGSNLPKKASIWQKMKSAIGIKSKKDLKNAKDTKIQTTERQAKEIYQTIIGRMNDRYQHLNEKQEKTKDESNEMYKIVNEFRSLKHQGNKKKFFKEVKESEAYKQMKDNDKAELEKTFNDFGF